MASESFMKKYDFDEIISRRGTDAFSAEGYSKALFGEEPVSFPCPEADLIRMWVADMDFSAPPEVLAAIKTRLGRKILGYTRIYHHDYYDILTDWMRRRYDWAIDRSWVVTSPGVVDALSRLVRLLLNPSDKLMILTPSYAPFQRVGEENGVAVVMSDLINNRGRYTVDFADFEKKAKDAGTKLFILCHPHNPTGRVWTREELTQMGEICFKNGVFVISDEIHCDLVRKGARHVPFAALFPDEPRIVTCTAPSKTFNLAGMLHSNILIPDPALRNRWLDRYNHMLCPLSVEATKAAYSRCDEWVAQLCGYLDENFRFLEHYLKTRLPRAVYQTPESTYLAWIDVSAYVPAGTHLPRFFAERAGILLDAEDHFLQNADGHVRLNIACPKSVLETALARMAEALTNCR